MKETPIFEEVFMDIVKQPSFAVKALVGGLVSFVPILNLLAFGYLYRLAANVRRSGVTELPDWGDWQGLFFDGLRFALVWLIYWLVPMLVFFGLSQILSAINLWGLSDLVLSVSFLFFSAIFCSALYRFQMRANAEDLLDVALILRLSYLQFHRFVIPSLVFLGLFAISPMFYGLTLFFGFLMLITFTTLCFRSFERTQRSHS